MTADLYHVCMLCAITRPQTVRQLIGHAIFLRGPSACGCAVRP